MMEMICDKLLRIILVMLTVLPAAVACTQKEEEEELDGNSLLLSVTGKWMCVEYKIDDVEQEHDDMYLFIPYPGSIYESNLPFLDSRNKVQISPSSMYFYTSTGNMHFFVSTNGRSPFNKNKPSSITLFEVKDSRPTIECSFMYVE